MKSFFYICFFILSWSCVKENGKSSNRPRADKSQKIVLKGKYVKVVTLDNYAPYTFSDSGNSILTQEKIPPGSDSKELKGFSWDTLREGYHAMGYTIYLTVRPWKRALTEFNIGRYEILFPTTKTPEREKEYFYSHEDTNFSTMNIYTIKDSKFEFKGLASLKGIKVGVVRGYSYGAEWDGSTFIETLENDSDQQNFKMLSSKRIPAIAAYGVTADYWLLNNKKMDFYKKHPSFAFNREYLVSLKTNGSARPKVLDFDEGKKKIIQSGLYKKIKKKWGIQ